MSKHTKGPWILDPETPGHVYSDDDTGSMIAKCGGFNYVSRAREEIDANTRLISAAPDLLEACKAMFAASDPSIGGSPGSPLELARAAIAKAEGA